MILTAKASDQTRQRRLTLSIYCESLSSALPDPVSRLPSLASRPPHDATVLLERRVLRLWQLVTRWRCPLSYIFRHISSIPDSLSPPPPSLSPCPFPSSSSSPPPFPLLPLVVYMCVYVFIKLLLFVFLSLVCLFNSFYILSLLCPFMASMSFAGYFLDRFLMSAFSLPFFSERVPDVIWLGSVCLVTKAGFVADHQLM